MPDGAHSDDSEVWDFLHRHLTSIFAGDWETYRATTAEDLGLYEHFVTRHRLVGLDFHKFMIENSWATRQAREWRFDLLDRRLQDLGDVMVASYTLMLSLAGEAGIEHRTHNETRVLARDAASWKVVHVHKSPA